jgi:hypothetical protein
VSEEEAAALDPAGDLFFYPIGPCCLRAHPEIRLYVQKSGGAVI